MTEEQGKAVAGAAHVVRQAKKARKAAWEAKCKAADDLHRADTELELASSSLNSLLHEITEPFTL